MFTETYKMIDASLHSSWRPHPTLTQVLLSPVPRMRNQPSELMEHLFKVTQWEVSYWNPESSDSKSLQQTMLFQDACLWDLRMEAGWGRTCLLSLFFIYNLASLYFQTPACHFCAPWRMRWCHSCGFKVAALDPRKWAFAGYLFPAVSSTPARAELMIDAEPEAELEAHFGLCQAH